MNGPDRSRLTATDEGVKRIVSCMSIMTDRVILIAMPGMPSGLA